MRRLLWICMLATLLAPACQAAAGEATADASAFADELFLQGDYFRAITEYKRVLFEDPSNTHAGLRIAESYLLAGRLPEAERAYRDISVRATDNGVASVALRQLASTLRKQGRYTEAAASLAECLRLAATDSDRDAIRGDMFWCHLYAEDLAAAESPLVSMTDEHLRKRLTDARSASMAFRRKNPVFAGCLSALVPGAGQLYVGRRKDALIAFAINGAFVWAAIEAYNEDLAFTGTALALVELSWYTGNIYSAVNGAHKHNRYTRERQLQSIEAEFGRVSYRHERTPTVPLLAVRIRF